MKMKFLRWTAVWLALIVALIKTVTFRYYIPWWYVDYCIWIEKIGRRDN